MKITKKMIKDIDFVRIDDYIEQVNLFCLAMVLCSIGVILVRMINIPAYDKFYLYCIFLIAGYLIGKIFKIMFGGWNEVYKGSN